MPFTSNSKDGKNEQTGSLHPHLSHSCRWFGGCLRVHFCPIQGSLGGKIGAEKETGAHFRWVGRCSLSLGTGGNGRTTLALWGPGPFLMISFAAVTSLLHG